MPMPSDLSVAILAQAIQVETLMVSRAPGLTGGSRKIPRPTAQGAFTPSEFELGIKL